MFPIDVPELNSSSGIPAMKIVIRWRLSLNLSRVGLLAEKFPGLFSLLGANARGWLILDLLSPSLFLVNCSHPLYVRQGGDSESGGAFEQKRKT